jgi:hypothetical protein
VMPSRYPTGMLGRNAVSALLYMCSDGGAVMGPVMLDGRRAIAGFARLTNVPPAPSTKGPQSVVNHRYTGPTDRHRGEIALAFGRLAASCDAGGGGEIAAAMRDRCSGVSADWAAIGSSSTLDTQLG